MVKLRCCIVSDPLHGRTVNGIVNRYGYVVKNGEKIFDKIGEIDAQIDINSFLESCDYRIIMDALIRQCGADFDFDSLKTMIADIDFTDPISVAAYMEILGDEFAALPVGVKNHYENNPRKFARDCIGGGAVDFINTFCVVDDGSEKTVADPVGGETAAGNNGRQPDIQSIMRQIDAINAKLGGDSAAATAQGGEKINE